MTTVEFYVILNKNFSLSKGQAKKIMEVCVKREDSSQHNKFDKACKKNKNMEELNANLKEAANYLIFLFNSTGQKYSCSRTKIGKILSIVAIIYAKEGKKIFNERIYKYKSDAVGEFCGAFIRELINIVDRDVYISNEICDTNSKINSDEIKEKENLTFDLPKGVKETIKEVFLEFGAYDSKTLGKCINPIILQEEVSKKDNEVDLSQIQHLSKKNFDKCWLNGSSELVKSNLVNYLYS